MRGTGFKRLILHTVRRLGYEVVKIPPAEIERDKIPPAEIERNVPIEVAPLQEIRYPQVDFDRLDDPIAAMLGAPPFADTVDFFSRSPNAAARSLMSPNSQALLYAAVRNIRPLHVFEIGTFRAGTSEAICRALSANGYGTLHTVDPFGGSIVPAILAQWPEELKRRIVFYPADSMAFFDRCSREQTLPDLVLVDGNHDYEYATFDIEAAARLVNPRGYIFVDNVSQAGPFFAAVDFLARHPGWQEHGHSAGKYRIGHAYDRHRADIPNTDFLILRGPDTFAVGGRPATSGATIWGRRQVRGIAAVVVDRDQTGTLYGQCVLRGFGSKLIEIIGETTIELNAASREAVLPFTPPLVADGAFDRLTVEPWLTWQGERPLRLIGPPSIF